MVKTGNPRFVSRNHIVSSSVRSRTLGEVDGMSRGLCMMLRKLKGW